MSSIQEKFWKGKFGNKYSLRHISYKKNFLKNIINKKIIVKSVFEIGTNVGNNLDVIKLINKKIKTAGVEINEFAFKKAKSKGHEVINNSIMKVDEKELPRYDLTLSIGVLIHINPNKLKQVYAKLYNLSKKYILIAEYFNDQPVSIKYRGKSNVLFKRDFAKEIKDKYKLKIVDYGFIWSEDKNYNKDNYNWFLLKK
jgi:pseudaminic acid biosynthesis-associated methylase